MTVSLEQTRNSLAAIAAQYPLTREEEVSAARMDVDLTVHRLVCTASWMRQLTRVPARAHIAFALAQIRAQVEHGNRSAIRALADYDAAATAYEGARVALAELLPN